MQTTRIWLARSLQRHAWVIAVFGVAACEATQAVRVSDPPSAPLERTAPLPSVAPPPSASVSGPLFVAACASGRAVDAVELWKEQLCGSSQRGADCVTTERKTAGVFEITVAHRKDTSTFETIALIRTPSGQLSTRARNVIGLADMDGGGGS